MAKPAKPRLRSGFEKKIKDDLDSKKIKYGYETEKIPYTVPSSKHFYVPDFCLVNGIYIEGKGKLDAQARKKMLLVIEQNPDKDIRLLFMRNNKIRKGSKTTYTDWAEKHGIPYHVSSRGEVPEEWLKPLTKRD